MGVGEASAFWLRSATHAGAPINKACRAVIRVSILHAEDPGDPAAPAGPQKIAVGRYRVDVEVYGRDPSDIRALPSAAAGNDVYGYVGDGAINEKHTLKNV